MYIAQPHMASLRIEEGVNNSVGEIDRHFSSNIKSLGEGKTDPNMPVTNSRAKYHVFHPSKADAHVDP